MAVESTYENSVFFWQMIFGLFRRLWTLIPLILSLQVVLSLDHPPTVK